MGVSVDSGNQAKIYYFSGRRALRQVKLNGMMKANKLKKLGIPPGLPVTIALKAVTAAERSGNYPEGVKRVIQQVIEQPDAFTSSTCFGELAEVLLRGKAAKRNAGRKGGAVPFRIWGEGFEEQALTQLKNACSLPVAVRAALMPDAHVGYGLPIGGVLAVKEAVIPYAVGADIACRMKMSVFDVPPEEFERNRHRFREALVSRTSFGVGATFRKPREHAVMDEDWSVSPVTRERKDKAWSQLGTSGSGNHFAEFGILTVEDNGYSIEPGRYVALLTHSGSRGTGNEVARHYSSIAKKLHPDLPDQLKDLSWLDLGTGEGCEYWEAMQLMGRYAAAGHELIHTAIACHIGAEIIHDLENHHNFAWKEHHYNTPVIVHRKGATPAGEGVYGIIPGSMATPGYIVRGRGNPASLKSASHGAGRKMSRNAARKNCTWSEARSILKHRNVVLISAGLDEVPMVYKDIKSVMGAQRDLVEKVARFDPRIVRMAPPGNRSDCR